MPTGTISQVRKIIKAKEIVELLQNSILGEERGGLTQNEINTAKVLLAKCIPDLKAIENSVSIEGSVTHSIDVKYVDTDSQ